MSGATLQLARKRNSKDLASKTRSLQDKKLFYFLSSKAEVAKQDKNSRFVVYVYFFIL